MIFMHVYKRQGTFCVLFQHKFLNILVFISAAKKNPAFRWSLRNELFHFTLGTSHLLQDWLALLQKLRLQCWTAFLQDARTTASVQAEIAFFKWMVVLLLTSDFYPSTISLSSSFAHSTTARDWFQTTPLVGLWRQHVVTARLQLWLNTTKINTNLYYASINKLFIT